ncbi:FtsW/RodA/SpoVE family cell cycle protein [Rathayibacter sp. AY1C6]|uniref:FtsW/RodA/SpoVE family cell cycle protein n=1 Tax=Rathayibacter sp. AY1C6 TaxID=2080539 RepID=UPI0015E4588F|nr:FtsW/RodA/SpoVE family cell cycle protein [Rathayibacter sp. AY1C6]
MVTIELPGDYLTAAVALAAAVLIAVVALRGLALVSVVALSSVGSIGVAAQVRLGADNAEISTILVVAVLLIPLGAWCTRAAMGRVALDSVGLRRAGVLLASAALVLRSLPALSLSASDLLAGTLGLPGGRSIQVGEFTRIAVVISFALLLAAFVTPRSGHVPRSLRSRLAPFTVIALNMLLLLGVDKGGFLVMSVAVLVATIAFARRRRWRWRDLQASARMSLIVTGTVLLAAVVIAGFLSSNTRNRFLNLIDPDNQLGTALSALQSGGIVGQGIGSSSVSNARSVPAGASDYLPAIVGSDLGILTLAMIATSIVLAIGMISRRAARADGVPAVLATALCAMLVFQTTYLLLGNIGLLPLTGLSMPFLVVSFSAVVPSALAIGIAIGAASPALVAPAGSAEERWPGPLVGRWANLAGALIVLGSLLVGTGAIRPAAEDYALVSERGTISTIDKHVLAENAYVDGALARVYPDGALYSDIGIFLPRSFDHGVEDVDSLILTEGDRLQPLDVINSFFQEPVRPADIVLTLDHDVQLAAQTALDGVRGSAVVEDATTGSIVALYSSEQPTLEQMAADGTVPDSPSRLGGTPPGSIFKIVTATAALLDNVDTSGAPLEVMTIDGATFINSGGFICDDPTILTMLRQSCNTTAMYIAQQIGAARLQEVAETYFGVDGDDTWYDGGSVVNAALGFRTNPTTQEASLSAIGQESVRANPLSITAMVSVLVASAAGKVAPAPHINAGICDSTGPRDIPAEKTYGGLIPQETAEQVLAGMQAAAEDGTARYLGASVGDMGTVVAKTGSAEIPVDGVISSIDSWTTAVLDDRWIVTVLVHDVGLEESNQAVQPAAEIISALPKTEEKFTC